MRPILRFTLTVALAAVSTVAAFAADPADPVDPGSPPAPQVRTSPSGVVYLVGGAGAESQAAMKRMQGDFALRIVYSAAGGEYAIPDHVTVTREGATVLDLGRAGPMVMAKLPPGEYRIATTVAGRTDERAVRVGTAPQTMNWKIAAS